MLRKILSSVFVLMGAGIATILFFRYFADLISTGGNHLGTQLGNSIEYLIAALACIGLGAALWKKWQIPVAEFWVVAGAFCLGVAFRSEGQEAEVHGAFGLAAFVIGYLILKYNADRGGTRRPDPRLREEAMQRMMDSAMPPGAFALMEGKEPDSSEPGEAASSLNSMIHKLGKSVGPALEKTGGRARKLVMQR
ncbi:MAG: hypothetical protein O2968_04530 [Acidobacteria bacterium]|nr:hypothetical protein [Acidobacteriota bacterium]